MMLHLSMQAQITQRQSLVFTPQLQQAIKLLLLNNFELSSYAEKVAEENPFVEVETPKAMPRLAMVGGQADHGDYDPIAHIADTSDQSFQAQIFRQVEDLLPDAASRAIGYALASHLEPTGWITEPLDAIADNMGVDWARAEQVLMQLQKAEPAGLFARNLTECLKLQVRGPAVEAARLHTLIDNLALIQAGELGALRRKLNCTQEELGQALRQLRGLDPKPGLGLGGADVMPVRAPDLRAYQDASGDWVAELNNATLPVIKVDETLGRRVRKLTMEDADREFVRTSLGTARWLGRAIAQRNETSIKVAAEIVRYQKAFLENGMQHMRPLKLKAIADAVGVHESTISRVTSSMMMQTPQGCFPLKVFFSTAINTDQSDEGASARVVREKIREMVGGETPTRPLSDDRITQLLTGEGFRIARRTVAKYRKMDRIPSSSERRRHAKIASVL